MIIDTSSIRWSLSSDNSWLIVTDVKTSATYGEKIETLNDHVLQLKDTSGGTITWTYSTK